MKEKFKNSCVKFKEQLNKHKNYNNKTKKKYFRGFFFFKGV